MRHGPFKPGASPAGMPAVEQGNLAALEGDDVRAAPRQRWRVALAVAVLLAIAALVWVMASGS